MFKITQWYGENPEYYAQFGLPGHEGLDLVAPTGQDIFSVKDGQVYVVETNPNASNYGIHVRIGHSNNFKTIYAHLQQSRVSVGQNVLSGYQIGDADSTGNAQSGSHLHLGEKEDGVTYVDENGTSWPFNFRDPWIHLQHIYEEWLQQHGIAGYLYSPGLTVNMQGEYARVVGTLNLRAAPNSGGTLLGQVTSHTVVRITGSIVNGYYPVFSPVDIPVAGSSNPAIGLHLRADPDSPKSGEWSEVNVLGTANAPNSIKLLHAHPQNAFREAGTRLGTAGKYIIRVFQTGWDRIITPQDFFNWNNNELANRVTILRNEFGVPAANLYIELHNEPNLIQESGNNWTTGTQFVTWANAVLGLFKVQPAYTGVKWVYPGLSPGGAIPNVRYDSTAFLQSSVSAGLGQFDYVGCHAYWSQAYPMQQAINHVILTRATTNKPVVLTEVSRNDRPSVVPPSQYGQDYAQFISVMRQQTNILGITFFVGSASNNFEPETWVTESNSVKGIATSLVNSLSARDS